MSADAATANGAAATTAAAPIPAGTIHDLGYRRYLGTRRPQRTRWRVIARQQLQAAWKGFWRFKLPLLLAVINTVVWIVALTTPAFLKAAVARFTASNADDVILAMSWRYYGTAAFLVSMTVTSGVVAADRASGAFSFYFARPVRARDYILGKLAGLTALAAAILLAGPVVLTLVRLGLHASSDEVLAHAGVLPRVLAIGAMAALAFAAVPLAISALVERRRYAIAVWAAYYLVFGLVATGLGAATGLPLGALDLSVAMQSLAYDWLDVGLTFGPRVFVAAPWAIASLLGHSLVAVAIVAWRIDAARRAGLGSSS
ncbi:MAG: ABC transporter permease subunit [Kofleriaceae bacterium]|nr:ABC transporter permease subunit [Kofleriaceae bacterium]MBP6838747.1 ABC transporter permease subunit [Kofleriaceae bacterium]MBP9203248.1 ABC transporter permease subunit [Kofleriaceae bacterium]